jgi:hypothetical protein
MESQSLFSRPTALRTPCTSFRPSFVEPLQIEGVNQIQMNWNKFKPIKLDIEGFDSSRIETAG